MRTLLPAIAGLLTLAGAALAQDVVPGQAVPGAYWIDGLRYDLAPGQVGPATPSDPAPAPEPEPDPAPQPDPEPAPPADHGALPPHHLDPARPGILHPDAAPLHATAPEGYATVCPADSGRACDHEVVQTAVGAGRIALWGGDDPAQPIVYRGWSCWSSSACDIVGFGKVRPLVVSVTERPLDPAEPFRPDKQGNALADDNPHDDEAVITIHGDMQIRDVNFLGRPISPSVSGVLKPLAPDTTIVIERVGFRKAHMCVYPVGARSTVTLRQVWCEGAGAHNRVHGMYVGSSSPPREVTVEFSYFGPQADDGNHIRYPHAGQLTVRYSWFGGPGDAASSALNVGCGVDLEAVGNVFWNGAGHLGMVKLDGTSAGCKGAARLRLAYNTWINTRADGRVVRAYFPPDVVVATEILGGNNLMRDAGPAGLTPARAWVDWAAEPKASYALPGFHLADALPATDPVPAALVPAYTLDGAPRDGGRMGALP